MFTRLRARLADIQAAPSRALPIAAARIQAKIRSDSTTKRGNVPAFGDMGSPTTVTAQATGITIRAADWVMSKAYDLAQPEDWRAILRDALRAAVKGAG